MGSPLGHIFQQMRLIFFKRCVPGPIAQARRICKRFLCYFSDPGALFFELSPAREHNYQKKSEMRKTCEGAPKSGPKWCLKRSRTRPEGLQMAFERVSKNEHRKRVAISEPTCSLRPPPPPEYPEGSGVWETFLIGNPFI